MTLSTEAERLSRGVDEAVWGPSTTQPAACSGDLDDVLCDPGGLCDDADDVVVSNRPTNISPRDCIPHF